MFDNLLLIALILFVVLVFFALKKSIKAAAEAMPCAQTGILETIEKISGNKAPWFCLEQAKLLGTNVFKLPLPVWGGVYVIGDYKLNREILLASTTDKTTQHSSFEAIMGAPSIFSSPSNSYWKMIRKSTAHAFSKKDVERMNRIAVEEAYNWMEQIDLSPDKGYSFDPNKDMLKITFNVICKAGFEYTPSDTEFQEFCESAEVGLREFFFKQQLNPLRRFFRYFIPEVREALHHCRLIQALAKRILDAYKEKPVEERSSNKTLVRIISENEDLNTRQRIGEVVTFLIAGMDTTGYTLATTLILLAMNPSKAEKLREELEGCDPKEWRRCNYFQQVLQESFRLMPVTAIGPTKHIGQDHWFEGKLIPKGSLVFLSFILQCYNEKVFPNPNSFCPERWSEDDEIDSAKMSAMKQSNIPFSIGNRNCVGQSLAKSELESLLPLFATKYRFEVEKEGGTDFFLTLKYDGFKLVAKKV